MIGFICSIVAEVPFMMSEGSDVQPYRHIIIGIAVVVVVGQTVGFISSKTLAYDCLCTLELCTH